MYLMPRRDSHMVATIKAGGAAGRRAQEQLYKQWNFQRAGIEKVKILGGTQEDGLSITHDAFIILIENIQQDHYDNRNKLKAYFLAIVKNRWLSFSRKQNKEYLVPEHHPRQDDAPDPEQQVMDEEVLKLTRQLLTQLGDVCLKILLLDIENYDHQEIASELGWADSQRIRDRKYKCRKRLREKHGEQCTYLLQLLNRNHGR